MQETQRVRILLEAAKEADLSGMTTRIIESAEQPKLNTIPVASESGNDLIAVVMHMRMMVGQDKDVSKEKLILEAQFLSNMFGTKITVQELFLALELFFQNELDFNTPPMVVFSTLFISNVINSYLRYRRRKMEPVQMKSETKLMLMSQRKPTDEERLSDLKDIVRECYKHAKARWSERFYVPMVYDLFVRKKMIAGELMGVNIVDAHSYSGPDIRTHAIAYAKQSWDEHVKRFRETPVELRSRILVSERLPAAVAETREEALQMYVREYAVKEAYERIGLDAIVSSLTIDDLIKL